MTPGAFRRLPLRKWGARLLDELVKALGQYLVELAVKRVPDPVGRLRGGDEQFIPLEFACAERHENRMFQPRLCSMKGDSVNGKKGHPRFGLLIGSISQGLVEQIPQKVGPITPS